MRSILLFAVIVSCVAVGFKFDVIQEQPPSAIQQAEGNIEFEWAFGAIVGKNKTLVSITRDTILKSGEEIKMMVKLNKECFVYVIYYGSKGEVAMLFPHNIQQFQKDYVTDKNYYIPKGRGWQVLDKNTGKEVFFLIASTERLIDLEAKFGNYISADESKKEALANEVISEVRNVRKRYSTFATLAEKPITIGGNIRGNEKVEGSRRPDVADIAIKIKANNFYSKTFTIDHQ